MRVRASVHAALLSLVTVGLLVPVSARAEGEPTTDPMAGAPAVGSCWVMTWSEAAGEVAPDTGVDCTEAHTTQVVAVGQLPDGVTWDQWSQVTSAVDAACDPAWEAVTTDDPLLYRRSAYQQFWFMPSEQQRDAGARWIRCDLAREHGEQLLSVTDAELPPVTRSLPAEVRRCMTADFRGTVCSASDRLVAWRGRGAFELAVPSSDTRARRKVNREAEDRCPRWTRTRSYAWSWFRDHDRRWIVVCYDRA